MVTTIDQTAPLTSSHEYISHTTDTTDTSTSTSTNLDDEKVIREERWIEMEADAIDDDDNEPKIQDLFADPDPYDTFRFNFRPALTTKDAPTDDDARAQEVDGGEEVAEEIAITLEGIKAENGQLLNSTGLTLWKASSLLCDFLCANPLLVRGRRVVELGAGLGLCGILAHRLGAVGTVMTDGDTDALENMRKNVDFNLRQVGVVADGAASSADLLPCAQLRWGRHVEAFKKRWTEDTADGGDEGCDGFDVIMGSDIIYAEDILEPLFDTVMELLSSSPKSIFLLAYARRNVKIDLVFECSERHGLSWVEPEGAEEGVFIFSRREL